MPEFFLPFLIGYLTSRILSFLLSSSRQTSHDLDSVLLTDLASFTVETTG